MVSLRFHPERPERGGPLLTVKSDANGDLWRTTEKGPSLVGWLGSSCGTWDFCPALVTLVSPVQKFFPHRTPFHFVSPLPSNLGRQPCRAACLLICASGFSGGGFTLKETSKGPYEIMFSDGKIIPTRWHEFPPLWHQRSCTICIHTPLCEKLWIRIYRQITCRNRALNSYR